MAKEWGKILKIAFSHHYHNNPLESSKESLQPSLAMSYLDAWVHHLEE